MDFRRFFRRRKQDILPAQTAEGNGGRETAILEHPNRTAAIIPAKPRVEVLDDYILVRDIQCVDADGNRFEYYPELLVAKDVERKNGKVELLTSYDASRNLKRKGEWLASSALTCNYLEIFIEHCGISAVADVLQQYKDYGFGLGWHTQGTLVDISLGKIIHYPQKEDFTYSGGQDEINKGRRRELSFATHSLKSMPIEEAIQHEQTMLFLKNFTGLPNLSSLLKFGEYFEKRHYFYFGSKEPKVRNSAWLGCYDSSFILYAVNDLYINGAARGVREPAGER